MNILTVPIVAYFVMTPLLRPIDYITKFRSDQNNEKCGKIVI